MSAYNLRKNPPPSSRKHAYIQELQTQRELASPRKRQGLANEICAVKERTFDPQGPSFDQVMLANEIVCGGRPPGWDVDLHHHDLLDAWQIRMGKQLSEFRKTTERIPWWKNMEFEVLALTKHFGVIDLQGNAIQGRSVTAKQIDGKEVEPRCVPGAEEMSWREWRRFSRACNLLLEAVDGMPWGWEMEDEQWEEYPRATEKFDNDLSDNPRNIDDLDRWEHP